MTAGTRVCGTSDLVPGKVIWEPFGTLVSKWSVTRKMVDHGGKPTETGLTRVVLICCELLKQCDIMRHL